MDWPCACNESDLAFPVVSRNGRRSIVWTKMGHCPLSKQRTLWLVSVKVTWPKQKIQKHVFASCSFIWTLKADGFLQKLCCGVVRCARPTLRVWICRLWLMAGDLAMIWFVSYCLRIFTFLQSWIDGKPWKTFFIGLYIFTPYATLVAFHFWVYALVVNTFYLLSILR